MNAEPNQNVDQLQQEKHKIEGLLEHQKKRMLSIFSKQLEQQFWRDREDRITTLIIRAFIPVTIFYLIFELISLPINYFTTEPNYRNHDILLTMISYTTGWVALFIVYLMAKHPVWRNYYSGVVTSVVCLGMSIVQIVLFSTESLAMTWRGTLIIVFAQMFAYLCSGIRPKYIFLSSLLSCLITCLVLWSLEKSIPPWVLFNVMILGNLVGLSLAILSVSTERIRFLQSIIIELDKQISEALNQHLYILTQQDTLTLLSNRRGFDQQLKHSFNEARFANRSFAILFIDVDFFKLYNDLYGHQNGDIALIRVAQTIRRHIGDEDVAVRYGGEEFVILLRKASLNEAETIGYNILKDIREQKIPHEHSKISQYLTVSIGLTLYSGENDMTQTDIIKVADFALYQAKRNGRDQLMFVSIENKELFNA
ncbi:GGDEF domain-containing protein [Acinetobacter stercoris]|uniref:diguanylate cyclase n=1 Tax=Acinetobacter stercoris TaxID=2126983 RepID=A0A2U3MVP2_9GAMM|nr:GGDEF domain-containing protein [Acinetobacter stercoris]SPL69492.1 Phytochrome-like protein cph2 [Acinetobacter stercoris]